MTITVKHKFVSAIPDEADATVVRPSNWNDDHQLTGVIDVANGGTGASTLTGYVKGNGTSTMTASTTIPSGDVSGLGTMATQNANSVAITGGSINGAVIGGTAPADITGNTITAATGFISQNFTGLPALGGNLKSSAGVALLNWDGAGSGNVTVNGGLNANPANKNVSIAPTGTGTATINPATTGAMNNMVIGDTTPKAITGTTITATTFSGSGASLTSIPNSALVNSAITINGTSTSLGGSISVGTVTSVAATVPSFLSVSGSPITSSGTLALTYSGTALPVANGGTGVTTSTGSGSNVLNTSPTLTTPAITGGTISNLTQELIGQSYDQGTGVLQVTGQSTFNGAVTDKSLNLQGGNNLVLNSATLVTQNITVTANTYTLSMTGTGTITLSGTSSGTLVGTGASTVVSKTFTPTAGTLTLTPTGSCTTVQLELGSVFSGYTATTGTAVTTTNNINVPSGQVLVQNGTATAPAISIPAKAGYGIYWGTNNGQYFNLTNGTNAKATIDVGNGFFYANSTGGYGWTNGTDSSGVSDTFLVRDAANTLAQRNSTNAQTFRTYLTYTDASNYSRYAINTTANYYQQASEAAGTGALKPVLTTWFSSASAPTATNIPAGNFTVWKNTTDGTVKLYANDGGTLKSIVLI